MTKPQWSEGQWWEVHHSWPADPVAKRIDRRRRTKATAERIAAEMRASGWETRVR